MLNPRKIPHSPIPFLPSFSRMINHVSFSVKTPLDVPEGRLNCSMYLWQAAFKIGGDFLIYLIIKQPQNPVKITTWQSCFFEGFKIQFYFLSPTQGIGHVL